MSASAASASEAGPETDAVAGAGARHLPAGPVLVTGAAGFVGFHVAGRLLDAGLEVVGLDNLSAYYDPALKAARRDRLTAQDGFRFERLDLADRTGMAALFAAARPRTVIHLAAQAGVRYSIDNPHAYADSNLVGFLNVLEGCRAHAPGHLVYASSSSVYGLNEAAPYGEDQPAVHPVSLYAATKRANELMAHSYSHLYAIPATGLRFFTVYGPWGRPDMAYFLFTKAMLEGRPITLYGEGLLSRDFTYIDDIAENVIRAAARPPGPDPGWNARAPDPATSRAPHRVLNIGGDAPVTVADMVAVLEEVLGVEARIEHAPVQPGDVRATHADTARLTARTGLRPGTGLREGLARFAAWYREFYASGA